MLKKINCATILITILIILISCSKPGLTGSWKSSDGKIILVFYTDNKYKVFNNISSNKKKIIESGSFEFKDNYLSIKIRIFGGQEKIRMKVQIQKDILILKSGRFSSGFRSFYRINE